MVQSQPGACVLAIAKGKITIASLYRTLLRASHGTCMIVMILICASIFGYFFTLTHVTRDRPPGLHDARFLFVSQYRLFSNRFRLSEIYLCSVGWINGRISQASTFIEFRVARGPSRAEA
jgi:hypothetical protein